MASRDDTWKWFVKWRDGLSCECCGLKAGIAMEFHHVKPETKKFTIASAVYNNAPLDVIRQELDKCIPVCANCHKVIHQKAEKPREIDTAEWARKVQLEAAKDYWRAR